MERGALKDLALAARQHVCDLAAGRKKWTMCVPVQDDDSDTLLTGAIDALLDEVKRLDLEVQRLGKIEDQAKSVAFIILDCGLIEDTDPEAKAFIDLAMPKEAAQAVS